jgi:hypothetical protein
LIAQQPTESTVYSSSYHGLSFAGSAYHLGGGWTR